MAYRATLIALLLAGACSAQDLSKVPSTVRPWAKYYASFKPQLDIEGEGAINAIALSPDASLLATAGPGNNIVLWNAQDGSKLATLAGHEDAPLAVAFSPNGAWLASCGKDKAVILWDVALRKLASRPGSHSDEATCLAFSRDSQWLASGGKDGFVRTWDVAGGKGLRNHEDTWGKRDNKTAHFTCVSFNPEGTQITAGATEGRSLSWQFSSTSPNSSSSHGGAGSCIAVGFTPDGAHRYTVLETTNISFQAQNRAASSAYASPAAPTTGFALAPNGRAFIVSGKSSLQVFPLYFEAPEEGRRTNTSLSVVATLKCELADIRMICLTGDGKRLAVLDVNGRIQFWGSDLPYPVEPDADVAELDEVFPQRAFAVTGLAASSDSAWLAVAADDLLIRLRQNGQAAGNLAGHAAAVRWLQWTDNGRLLSCDVAGKAILWDVARLRAVAQVQLPAASLVACAPDGSMLAVGADGEVAIWDVVQGQRVHVLSEKRPADKIAAVDEVLWSLDGERVAVRRGAAIEVYLANTMKAESTAQVTGALRMGFSADSKKLRVMTAASLVTVDCAGGNVDSTNELAPETDSAAQITFASDGSHVAWVDVDGTRIYGADGKLKKTLPGMKSWTALAFEGNGRLLTGASDGRVRFWKLD